MIRAVFFDLDGTLADTLEDLANSVNAALNAAGYSKHSLESYKSMIGNGLKTLIRRCLITSTTEELIIESIRAEAAKIYKEHALDTTQPYPGILLLLDALAKRKMPCSVLSNKPDPFAKYVVAELFPGYEFIEVRGESDQFPPKPDPASALDLCNRQNISPSEVLYVGDSEVDILTAKAAGMVSVGVTWGFRERQELEAAQAEYIIELPAQLMELLEP